MLRMMLLCAVVLLVCSAACASDTDWAWSFGFGYFAHFGTNPPAVDDMDAQDVRIVGQQYYYYATYHQNGLHGWTGDTGFYSRDIRAPLQLVPGWSETWTFYMWGDPSHTSHLELMWGWDLPSPAFEKMRYTMTYIRSAEGVTGGSVPVGTSRLLNTYQQGTWSFPLYNTTDGLTGYVFEFTATVIPEPSSLLALSAGLVSAGALLRRRRR